MEIALQPSEKTILEQLESQGHSINYQCRSGYCGSCRCKKKSGDIEYDQEPIAFINDGDFLPCCSHAKSDLLITIDS